MTLILNEKYNIEEDSYDLIGYEISVDGVEVGIVSLMVDGNSTYIERLDIHEEFINKGHGIAVTKEISSRYDIVFAAPDNANSQRLLQRIGSPYSSQEADSVDQGFGVYRV